MIDIYDFYERMTENDVMISFKGELTSELLTSILLSIESKLDFIEEVPKVRKKVFSVLVECLQNLYHHTDENESGQAEERNAIFMVSNHEGYYYIYTGNHILAEHVLELKTKIDKVNQLDKDELKTFYKEVLSNGQMSKKGGGGLGMIDIARKSGQKLEYNFLSLDETNSFFTLKVKIERFQKSAVKDGVQANAN
jgi:hypothetical protein